MDNSTASATLETLRHRAGAQVANYLLGSKTPYATEIMDATELDARQLEVLEALDRIAKTIPNEMDESAGTRLYQSLLMQLTEVGRPVASLLHDHAVGAPFTAPGSNRLERSLAALTNDVFPAYLMPVESELPSVIWGPRPNILVASLLHRHPKVAEFAQEILVHPTFRKFFTQNSDHSGITTRTLRVIQPICRSVGR